MKILGKPLLGHIIGSSDAKRFHGDILTAMACHDDHVNLRVQAADRPDQVQAVHPLHLEIGQDHRGVMIRQMDKRLGTVLGIDCVASRVLVDQSARTETIDRVVVHNQNFRDEPASTRAW